MIPRSAPTERHWRADENFREAFRLLARGASRGAIREEGRICLIGTGVPLPLFNPVFAPAGSDFTAVLAQAREFYRARATPWALVIPDHDVVAPPARLREAGLYQTQAMPVLTRATEEMDGTENLPEAAAGVEIRVAETEEDVADHRFILSQAFGIEDRLSRIALPGVPSSPLLRLYVAYRNGEAVGSAAMCEGAGLAGVYNVASRPDCRRQGIATALMRHVFQEARERNLRTCVLQSSTAGLPLYARLGFTRLSTYFVYTDDGAEDDEDDA